MYYEENNCVGPFHSALRVLLSACQSSAPSASTAAEPSSQASSQAVSEAPKPAEITVVTSYGGDDGNRGNYEDGIKAYEQATGNTVKDASGTSDEEWKAKIMADFETGAEPDVLFYFNGADSNKLVQGGKVVGVDDIRKVYPEYAGNMKDELMGASPVDGKNYSVPVNGYWEALFVNKKVLSDCGVTVPAAGYTWDQFLADCETIKGKGYTPIACSLQQVPHYWFEYCIFNHDTVETHTTLPASSSDAAGKNWADGLNDIKTLYERAISRRTPSPRRMRRPFGSWRTTRPHSRSTAPGRSAGSRKMRRASTTSPSPMCRLRTAGNRPTSSAAFRWAISSRRRRGTIPTSRGPASISSRR